MQNLAMLSIRRPGGFDYVHQTLLSLLAVGEYPGVVHLFLGNADSSHLDYLAASPRFELHRMDAVEWGSIAGWRLQQRQAYAAWKAMKFFADRGEDLCLCEDDLLFDVGFWPKLGEAVAELDKARPDGYLLTTYTFDDYATNPGLELRKFTAKHPRGNFWGAQGMYFPASVLPDFTAHQHQHGVVDYLAPTDILYRDLSTERDCLYLTTNSLVQHTGDISPNPASEPHYSSTFGRPWPPSGAP